MVEVEPRPLPGDERGHGLIACVELSLNKSCVVEAPIVAIQLAENKLKIKVCANCLKPIGTLVDQMALLCGPDFDVSRVITPDGGLPFMDKTEMRLTDIHECRHRCGACYCSLECEIASWTVSHQLLCEKSSTTHVHSGFAAAWESFQAHSASDQESFMLAALAIARLACAMKEKDWEQFDIIHGRLSKLCGAFWWDLVQVPADVPASKVAEYRATQLRKKMLGKSLGLLSTALMPVLLSDEYLGVNEKDIDSQGGQSARDLLSEEGYGKLLGQLLQNSLCIDFPHPVRQYLDLVASNLAGALGDEAKVEAILQQLQPLEEALHQIVNYQEMLDAENVEDDDEDNDEDDDEDDEEDDAEDDDEDRDEDVDEEEDNDDVEEEGDARETRHKAGAESHATLSDATLSGCSDRGQSSNSSTNEGQAQRLLALLARVSTEFALNFEGSGLFPIVAWANHSCRPNASAEFPFGDRRCALVTTEAIPAGGEVCISYIENDEPLEIRTSELYEYNFVCKCPKCVAERGGPAAGKRKGGMDTTTHTSVDIKKKRML